MWNPANVVFPQLLLSEALGACARLRMVARLVEVRNADELDRAIAIGAEYLVMHPGSAKDQTLESGMETLARSSISGVER